MSTMTIGSAKILEEKEALCEKKLAAVRNKEVARERYSEIRRKEIELKQQMMTLTVEKHTLSDALAKCKFIIDELNEQIQNANDRFWAQKNQGL